MLPNNNENSRMKWSGVINQVQSANQQQLSDIQIQQKLRKEAYKHSLDQQVKQKHQNYYSQRKKAQETRKQIERMVAQQITIQIKKKLTRKQCEQSFKQENKKLLDNIQNDKIQLTKVNNTEESPFFKLIDHENQRKIQLKQKFKYQNHLNDIQSKIRQNTLKRQKQQQNVVVKNFNNHVQRQYLSRQTNRKNYISKYLNNKDTEKSHIQKQYRDYLDQQVDAQRNQKSRQKEFVDETLQSFNQKYATDSSPAFLGRIPAEHDRQRQMQYIDKNLGINNGINNGFNNYNNRVSTQGHQRSKTQFNKNVIKIPKTQQNSVNQTGAQNQRKVSGNLDKYSSQSTLMLPSLDKWRAEQAPGYMNINLGTNQGNSNSRRVYDGAEKIKTEQSKGQLKRTNRSFLQYNVITGQQKRVFL